MQPINHILEMPSSLLEIINKKIKEQDDKIKEETKKYEKIIINPDLNNPAANTPNGNNAPDMQGNSNVNSDRAQS